MSELPPPPPGAPTASNGPGGHSAPSPAPGVRSGPDAANAGPATDPGADVGWDWDRAKDLAEAWFRPVADVGSWIGPLGYLFFGALLAPFFFGAMAGAGAITFGLLFVVVGFLLVVPVFKLVELMVGVEGRLARLAGHEIEFRPKRPLDGFGFGSLAAAVTDPVRWRHVGFIAANLLLAPLLFTFGSFPVSFVLQVVFGDGVISGPGFTLGAQLDGNGLGLFAVPLAALAVGAIPRAAIWVARLKANIANWFVGKDRLAAAEQRVSDLSSQRRDILDAVASERRRIERNLHDGVQQQLVAIGLDLGMAEQQLDRDPDRARELLTNARTKVQGSIGELRQLGRGLHPAILEDRGIDAALSAIVSGAAIPISVHVDPDLDLSTDVAETVYFIANEAIANVLKHARAKVASVHVAKVAANVRVTVHDDGIGGVDASRGTGVAGIRARVRAVDGSLTIVSPPGGPTTLVAEIPRLAGGPS